MTSVRGRSSLCNGRRAVVDGTLAIGRYAGEHIADVDPGYLQWLLGEQWLDLTSRRAIEEQLDVDRPEDGWDADPDPTSAAVVLPGVAFAWWTTMRERYAGDPAALAVVEAGLAELKEACSRYTGKAWLTEGDAA
jgi:hypothetical protein